MLRATGVLVVALGLVLTVACPAAAQGWSSEPAPDDGPLPAGLAEAADRALAADGVAQIKLTASDGAFGDRFGRGVVVSEDGQTAVIGALLAEVNGNLYQGAAYVFTRDGDAWVERQKLVSSDGSLGDRFGSTVAMDGDTLVVGAWGHHGQRGAAYVFTRTGDTWTEQTRLTAPDGTERDSFGEFVAVDGDTVLVAAPLADGEGTNFEQGAAYVFTRSGADWGEPTKLTDPDGERNDQFGRGITLAGDTALVGAPFAGVGDNFLQGEVHEFTRDGGTWQRSAVLTVADGVGLDRFGFSLALAGDTALIGAIGVEVDGNAGAGAAYVFTRDGAGWTERARLSASDAAAFDNFGASVSLHGDRALVGADFAEVDGNPLQGAAYAFTGSGDSWQEEAKLFGEDGAENDSFGRPVHIAGDLALVGVPSANVDGDDARGAAYLFSFQDAGGGDEITLTAADGAANDWFGRDVAISGDTALVGADAADVAGTANQGAAYVFVRDGDTWREQAKLTASDGERFDQFGISVALSGDTALIGGGSNLNAAYVFTRNGEQWRERAKLTASDGTPSDGFGIDVALAGDTALVGAREADVAGRANQGAAYVFVRDGEQWREQAKLTASDGAALDVFGDAVALSGDTAVVGAAFADPGGIASQGAAWVFTREGDAWREQAKLTAGDGASGDWFGTAVAVAGDTALVGASQVDGSRGAAYAFVRDGDGWTEQARLAASDGEANDWFGNAVALAGDAAVVGAWFADGQGAAYAFVRDGDGWTERARLAASDGGRNDQFGDAVAIAGATTLVGSWLADVDGRADRGATYVYQLDLPEPVPPEIRVEPDRLSATLDAGGATTEPVTIGNLGEAPLEWTVEPAEQCGTPTELGWLGAAPDRGATPAGGSSEVAVTLDATGLAPGEHAAVLCVASNDPARPLVEVPVALTVAAVGCDETITGTHDGPLTVSEGVTCLAAGARVLGEVNVAPGAGLTATAAAIQGPVSAVGASVVEVAFSQITGPVLVSDAAGPVSLFATQVTGSVSLVGNATGEVPATVSGNTIIGSLSCFRNQPPPTDHGLPNTATGGKLGECAAL